MNFTASVSALAIITIMSTATGAAAQDSTAPPPMSQESQMPEADNEGLADIIVTAQKRSERLNSVPLAISAIGAAEIASRGISDTAQLTAAVPSFNVLKSAYGQPIFYIRGVGFADTTVSISPAVSIYIDETPLPYTTMSRGAAFDLERVEVLKGPQGTLFGQNSTGGAVNYIAAKPTRSLAAGIDLEAGRFGMANASAFVSGPLSDTLSARVAIQSRYQDDWQRSISRGEERGQQSFFNGRVSLDWQPNDSLRFALTGSAWQDKSDNQAPQFQFFAPATTSATANRAVIAALTPQRAAPNDSRVADWDAGSRTAKNDRFYQIALRGEYDLPWATLTSISSYGDAKVDSPADVDGTPYTNTFFVQIARLKTFSQELRLNGSLGERLRWLVGGNFQYAETNELLDQTINGTNNIIGPFTYTRVQPTNNQRVKTYAGFGSLEYKLTDEITARASGRYTVERRKFDGCLRDSGDGNLARAFSFLETQLAGQPVTIAPGACITFDDATRLPLPTVNRSLDEENFSWRTGLDWQVNPSTLLYANISKGYKSGGFTAIPAVSARQLAPITQESVLAYEGGLKASLVDNRLQLNLAGFYYDYKNKQLQGFVNIVPFGPIPQLVNIPTSRVIGGEADLTLRPARNTRLQVSAAYLDTKATSATAVPIGPLGGPYDFNGESFPNTPKYQVTADAEQRFDVSDRAQVYAGASLRYRSSASAIFGSSQNVLTRSLFTIPDYALIDLRAGISFDEGKTLVEAWGRNVTDEFYIIGVSRNLDTVARYTGTPATYGLRVSWKY